MVIIVGLGNMGSQYQNTYHNVGFDFADKMAEKLNVTFTKEKFKALICEGFYNGEKVLIAKPLTFMNNSGESVALLKKKFKDARIIVVVDDIDLPLGDVRYRQHGQSGTHNGMRSIVSYIGEEFERVRIGIGRDITKDLADYVLSKMSAEAREKIDNAIERATMLILEKIS